MNESYSKKICTVLQKKLESLKNNALEEITRTVSTDCQNGYIFDMETVKPTSKTVVNTVDNLVVTPDRNVCFEKVSVDFPKAIICFIYKEREEKISRLDFINQSTILETPNTHFIFSQSRGLKTVVNLFFDDESKHQYQKIIQMICEKNYESDYSVPEGISFSISGNLPNTSYTNHLKDLDNNGLHKICLLHEVTTFEESTNLSTLRVKLLPLDLKQYYSPLLERLLAFNNASPSSDKTMLQDLERFIMNLVTNKIEKTAELIFSGQSYSKSNNFLKELNDHFFLDQSELEFVITSIKDNMQSQVDSSQKFCDDITNNAGLHEATTDTSVQFFYVISPQLAMIEMQKRLETCFKNEKLNVTKNHLIKEFKKFFQSEIENAKSEIKNKSQFGQSSKNFRYTITYSMVKTNLAEQSHVKTTLLKDGAPVQTQPPLLDAPILADIIQTDNRIAFKYELPQNLMEHSNLITQYSLVYFMVHNETEKECCFTKWEETTPSQIDFTLQDFEEGVYVFQLKAVFDEFHGILSEFSPPIFITDKANTLKCGKYSITQIYSLYDTRRTLIRLRDECP